MSALEEMHQGMYTFCAVFASPRLDSLLDSQILTQAELALTPEDNYKQI